MKQRLLLALLMLFSSVGFMKVDAQISITLPKTEEVEDVTITFKGKGFTQGDYDEGSYPYFGKGITLPTFPTATQVVYKFSTKTDDTQTLTLQVGNAKSTWGDVQMELDGKVSAFVVTANPKENDGTNVLNYITSLSFTNNGVLERLVLASKNAYKTTGLPKLASLSCAGNKLNHIPSKLGDDGKVKLTPYNVGEQSPSSTMFTPVNVTAPKGGLTLTTSLFDQQTSKIFSETVTGALTISELKDKGDKVVNYAKLESGKYFFKDGDIFMDGEFTAKIAVGSDDKNYPGVVICGVPVKVNEATFALDKDNKITIEPKDAGTINVTEPEDSKLSSLTRNTVVKLTPAPESGYEFDKFKIVAGLEAAGQDGNSYSFKVTGDKDPEIKAIFKAKGATVTYNTPDAAQGTLRVTKAENNELVPSGNTVPVGTKLLITAKAKDGYEVGDVTFKKADKSGALTPGPEEDKKDASEKTWTYEVTIDGLDVQAAAFTALKKELTLTGAVGTITVKDTEGNEYKGGSPSNVYTVPVGKELVVTLKSSTSVTDGVINYAIFNSTKYDVVKKQDGSYELKGIVMPNQDSKLVFETSTLQEIEVTPAWTEGAELPYTGTKQEVTFTFDKNVEANSFVVEYKKKTDTDAAYTKEAFKEVGEYKVRITRPADDKYKDVKKEVTYQIVQADLIVEAPTVEYEDGKFVFAGGDAYFMNGDKKVDVDGEFVALNDGGNPLSEDEMADYKDKTEVKVNYSFDNANVKGVDNFMLSYGDAVESATIKSVGTNALTFSLKSTATTSSSSALLADGAEVSVGSTIMFSWDEIEGLPDDNYAVYQANANGEKLSGVTNPKSDGYTIKDADKGKTLYFLLKVEDKRTELALSDQAKKYFEERNLIYSGSSLNGQVNFVATNTPLVKKGTDEKQTNEAIYDQTKVTYWKDGKEVKELIDAGTYTVKMERDASTSYLAFSAECTITIKKATLTSVQVPETNLVASTIGKGQPLSTSKLTGQATIAGEYKWDEKYANEILTQTNSYPVVFYPADANNYEPLRLTTQVKVEVSDKPILTITCDETKGTVEVSDSDNNYYYDGDAIDVNSLRFVAKAKDGYTFESYSFIHGGTPTTVKNSDYTTTPNGSSIDVTVNFKEKSAEIVYHKINISTSGVGFAVSTTSGSVKEGDSFNFNMSAHPSDYTSIVVRDNKGKSYKVSSSGACTIDNVQEDLQLTVSLSNPTKYNVTLLADEYKDSEGNLMGTANFSGNTYYGGTITLTAVPKEGYKFVGWLNAGTTSTATTVQVTVTSNMTISARFESDGTIDPNTECIIRTPYDEDLTGVSINKQGVNVVKIGSDFEFTVAAYKDDLARVKVTVDGAELKPTTGNKYVISKVKKNTEVKVTLDNPTRIKVVIEKETKNAKGYVMGHVDVDVVDFGTYYPDSTCYYNTKLRLAAYPESGVEFKNWSDVTSNTDLIREITVTDNVTIKPVFEGTPTGIEDIMAASIATGKGCVWVRGIANADVTIVSITGRVQARQRISGDTRINVPAGIYVILLESGSDVKRAKVIVK